VRQYANRGAEIDPDPAGVAGGFGEAAGVPASSPDFGGREIVGQMAPGDEAFAGENGDGAAGGVRSDGGEGFAVSLIDAADDLIAHGAGGSAERVEEEGGTEGAGAEEGGGEGTGAREGGGEGVSTGEAEDGNGEEGVVRVIDMDSALKQERGQEPEGEEEGVSAEGGAGAQEGPEPCAGGEEIEDERDFDHAPGLAERGAKQGRGGGELVGAVGAEEFEVCGESAGGVEGPACPKE